VIRPDLPEPLLDAVARALEPDVDRRTITASEFADVVRTEVDVEAGGHELADLLLRWKGLLERGVKRAPDQDAESLGGRAVHTLRYEEVALAFDDEASADAPTLVAHALPSDPQVLAAMPLVESASPSSTAPPLLPPAAAARSDADSKRALVATEPPSSSARRAPEIPLANGPAAVDAPGAAAAAGALGDERPASERSRPAVAVPGAVASEASAPRAAGPTSPPQSRVRRALSPPFAAQTGRAVLLGVAAALVVVALATAAMVVAARLH
jgi:hypothetical protein